MPVLAEHIRRHPPVDVALPWMVPDGEPVTFILLVTGAGGALHRTGFNKAHWRPARKRAGIAPSRWAGMHVLRHTAASAWLSAGVDVAAVAAWLADTVQTVYATYAHMVPGAATGAGRRWICFSRGVPWMCPRRVGRDAPPQVSALRCYFQPK